MTIEDAGKVLVLQKAISALNVSPEEIAKACLFQKGLINDGTPMEDAMEMINGALKDCAADIDVTSVNMDDLIKKEINSDQIINSFAFDKVLEAGGTTLDGLRQENADKSSVSNAVKEMLHSNGASPEGLAGAIFFCCPYAGAGERFFPKGGPINKKNDVLRIFKNFTL